MTDPREEPTSEVVPEPMDTETFNWLDYMDDDDHIERERKEDALDDRYERDYGDR